MDLLRKRFLLYPSMIIALLVVAASASVLIGRTQPVPEEVMFLHLGDMCQLPCWIGITPGKTLIADAQTIVEKVYNHGNPLVFDSLHGATNITISDQSFLWIALNDGYSADTSRVVNNIELDVYPHRIPLGYVIEAFGLPDGVDLGYACCAGLELVKPWGRIKLSGAALGDYSPRNIYPSQPVNLIVLTPNTNRRIDLPWRGYGTYHKEFAPQSP